MESPEARPFGLPGADVLSISSSGEMAVGLNRHFVGPFERAGTLARIGMTGGGTPREIQEEVQFADWAPDGQHLAIVRTVGSKARIEYPIGKTLFETDGWISHLRISPDGAMVAFIHHPAVGDDGGDVSVIDRAGKARELAADFSTAGGLAWPPSGREVWFTAAEVGGNRALWAVTLTGTKRVLARVTGNLTLHDVARDGRVLVSHDTLRSGILGFAPGDAREKDLSWLDWSGVRDIAKDGTWFAFVESGEGGGPGYSAYTRRMDGSPPVRLGEGSPWSISPDGRWVLGVTRVASETKLSMLPTGAGAARNIPLPGLAIKTAEWLPDGKAILITANEPKRGDRLFLLDSADAKPHAVSPPGYRAFLRGVSPDGKLVGVQGPDRRRYLYPLSGGEPKPIPGIEPGEDPVGWMGDGRWLFVFNRGKLPGRVFRVELASGKREFWKELVPLDPAGISVLSSPALTPDGKTYVYSYNRILSDLFLATGVK
jgi:dipeptidyl aminopeptidase/acylaminoacyl peptidase